MKYLYRIYQLFIAVPIMVVWTIIIALIVIIGCTIGNGHFWGYHPGKWWAWFTLKLFLLPVKVEGREKVERGSHTSLWPTIRGHSTFSLFTAICAAISSG